MSLRYIKKLGLKVWKTNIRAMTINDSILETFEIVIAKFHVVNKVDKLKFF